MDLERIETAKGISAYRVSLKNRFIGEIIQVSARSWDYMLYGREKTVFANRAKTRKQIIRIMRNEYQERQDEKQDNR